MKKIILIWIVLILLPSVRSEAGTLKPSYAIGGGSYLLEKYFEKNEELYSEEDLRLLSAAMELENGSNSDECLYLTGSVILNRRDYCKWCPDTIRGVLYQKGQYAKHTVDNLETVQVSDRVRNIALNLLLCGTRTPKNLVYQAMRPQGKHYKKVDTEYFGLEE